jgi:plasmid segregation protein ParM
MIIAADTGRSESRFLTEVNGQRVFKSFPSLLRPYFKTEWDVIQTPTDTVIEYEGEAFYIGEIVDYVKETGDSGRVFDPKKDGKNTLLFTLLGLYRLGANEYDPVDLVIGTPLNRYQTDKDGLKQLLTKRHHIKVTTGNGTDYRVINIRNTAVTVEGAGIFFANVTDELVRIIDLGAVTLNALTFRNKRFIPTESYTFNWGWDTLKPENRTHKYVAALIHDSLATKWGRDDKVMVGGGQAVGLAPALAEYFPNAYAVADPRNANVEGYFRIGKVKYK